MKRRGYAMLADKIYVGHAPKNELKQKGIKHSPPKLMEMASDERSQSINDAYRHRNVVKCDVGQACSSSGSTAEL